MKTTDLLRIIKEDPARILGRAEQTGEPLRQFAETIGMLQPGEPWTEKTYSAALKLAQARAKVLEPLEDDTQGQIITTADVSEPAKPLQEDFLKIAQNNLPMMDSKYLSNAGISLKTAMRLGLGYCEDWINPRYAENGWKTEPSPRIIIPTGLDGYTAIDARQGLTADQERNRRQSIGNGLFNDSVLNGTEPVFIVLGELEAVALEELGHRATAIGTAYNVKTLLAAVADLPTVPPIIVSMNNPENVKTLRAGLQRNNATVIEQAVNGEYNTINKALSNDRAGLQARAEQATELAKKAQERKAQATSQKPRQAGEIMAEFEEAIKHDPRAISTGFHNLDSILNGGLYPGLYVLGATSAMGKTTFTMQIMDQIARQGEDVLIFALEMASTELIGRSISRITAELTEENDKLTYRNALGYHTVMRPLDSPVHIALRQQAINRYKEYADHVFISEGVGNMNTDQIRAEAERFVIETGRKPVIVVDYFQILAPSMQNGTDKQNTDKAVLDLKRLSRDLDTPVVIVSSFNRASYTGAVTMSAFKESGAIEYSADVLIALQYSGMDKVKKMYKDADIKQFANKLAENISERNKKGYPTPIQAVILKNRNGLTNSAYFDYMKGCYLFRETAEPAIDMETD